MKTIHMWRRTLRAGYVSQRVVALVNLHKPRHNPYLLFLKRDSHYAILARKLICGKAVYNLTDYILGNSRFDSLSASTQDLTALVAAGKVFLNKQLQGLNRWFRSGAFKPFKKGWAPMFLSQNLTDFCRFSGSLPALPTVHPGPLLGSFDGRPILL